MVMIYFYNAPIYSHHRWRAVWRDGLRVEIWQLRWWQPKSANYLLFITKTKFSWLSSKTKICSFFQDAYPCALLFKPVTPDGEKKSKFRKDCTFPANSIFDICATDQERICSWPQIWSIPFARDLFLGHMF